MLFRGPSNFVGLSLAYLVWVARISPRTRYPLWGTGVQVTCDHGKRPLSKESAVRILEDTEQRSERFLKLGQHTHTTLQFIAYPAILLSTVCLLLSVIPTLPTSGAAL